MMSENQSEDNVLEERLAMADSHLKKNVFGSKDPRHALDVHVCGRYGWHVQYKQGLTGVNGVGEFVGAKVTLAWGADGSE